jgi:glycosyltransferase involved in cell wall biosynthesis
MKLLIITQKADKTDPVLGFFHRWIEELALHCTEITVIAQKVGVHDLPKNVRVLSLGKEAGVGRFAQILRFWKLLITERSHYDRALVHMTPIWSVLGTPLWLLLRKPQYLWYESRGGRWPLTVALMFVRKVFSASPYGMPYPHPKQVITGHGIDTNVFHPGTQPREKGLLVSAGRITRAKRIGLMVECLAALPDSYHLVLAGTPITDEDKVEDEALRQSLHHRMLSGRVTLGALEPSALPPLLGRAETFLHASVTSLDKAVLEAMACGCFVVSSAKALAELLPPECTAHDHEMAQAVLALSALPPKEAQALRDRLRAIVVERHSLQSLAKRLTSEMS